ncbi:zinc finger protein 39-like isoform X2 [Ambystoma mexicanum]|uniref:zinc finger protein 39-like isoform X2 n=1 Tax=Ambystoma mexicanum TaxID=8296 RepID=UPI0037E837A0
MAQVTFCDVAAGFSDEEWKLLHEWQKELYHKVMKGIQQALLSLGPLIADSVFSLKAKENEDPCPVNHEIPDRKRNATLSPGISCFNTGTCVSQEESSETIISHHETKADKCSLSPSSVVSVCIKAEDDTSSMDLEDSGRRKSADSPTGLSFLNADFCMRNAEEDLTVNLTEKHGVQRARSSIEPSRGVKFRIREEEEIYSVEDDDSDGTEDHGGPTDGPVVTAVFSLSLEREEEPYFQEAAVTARSSNSGQPFSKSENKRENTEPKANETVKIKPDVLQTYNKGANSRSEQWTQNGQGFGGETTVQCKQGFNNLALSNLYEGEQIISQTGNHRGNTEAKTNGVAKFESDVLQFYDKEANCRSQLWKENDQDLGGETTVKCKSGLNNRTRSNEDQAQLPTEPSRDQIHFSSTFRNKSNLLCEQNIFQNWEKNACNEFEEHFSVKEDLKIHQQMHHIARSNKLLNMKQGTHSGEQGKIPTYGPYVCNECGKVFSLKHSFKRHQKRHTGVRYACTQCEKSFTAKASLTMHHRTHTGEKFTCGFCQKSFTRRCNLNQHHRKHTECMQEAKDDMKH